MGLGKKQGRNEREKRQVKAQSRSGTRACRVESTIHQSVAVLVLTVSYRKKTRCSGHLPCMRCKDQDRACQYMPLTTSSNAGSVCPPGTDDDASVSRTMPADISLDGDASAETPEEALQGDQYGHMHGGASEFAFLHYTKQVLAKLPSASIQFSDHPLGGPISSLAILPPKSVADEIISNFFDFGLTTVRFIHKPSLFAKYQSLYDAPTSDAVSQDNTALVLMVMALGSHYSKQDNAFCGFAAR